MMDKFGIPVVLTYLGADYLSNGIRDEVDETMLETDTGAFVGRTIVLTLRRGDFPEAGLVSDALITVDGEDMTIISAARREDGSLVRVLCART